MPQIDIFFICQFELTTMTKNDRELAISNAIQRLNGDRVLGEKNIRVNWRYWEVRSGEPLTNQIFELVNESELIIADLTGDNLNVYFELGISFVLQTLKNKDLIWMVYEEHDLRKFPSDILGTYVEKYNSKNYEIRLFQLIRDKILSRSDTSEEHTFPGFWQINEFSQVDIVCSSIPEDIWPWYAKIGDRNYLKYAKFADLDSLIHLKSELTRVFPRLEIRDKVDTEDNSPDFRNLIIIGGPSWNRRTRSIQRHLPFRMLEMGEGNDDIIHIKYLEDFEKKEFVPIWDDNQNLLRDVSVVSRITINQNRVVFVFIGCLTYGVLGAVKSVLEENIGFKNTKYLDEIVGKNDLMAMFYSENIEPDIIPPLFESTEDFLLLVKDIDKRSEWEIQERRGIMFS